MKGKRRQAPSPAKLAKPRRMRTAGGKGGGTVLPFRNPQLRPEGSSDPFCRPQSPRKKDLVKGTPAMALSTAVADENSDDELAGEWVVVSAWCNGKPIDGRAEYVFARGALRITPRGRITVPLHYQLLIRTSPKAMDITAGSSAAPEKLARTIYELKGRELKICMPSSPHTEPFPERPLDFTLEAGKDLWLLRRKVGKKR